MAWNEPGNRDENPWNKNNRNDDPLDFDEWLRRLQKKINGFFGGNNQGPTVSKSGVISLLIGLIVVWLVFGYYTVNEQERAIVLRFGRYHETLMPGFSWRPLRPLGIDNIIKINVTSMRSMSDKYLMLTEDDNIVQVNLTVQYSVDDPKKFLLGVRDPEISLQQATESALRHVVGSSQLDSVLSDGRVEVAAQVKTRIQQYMNNYGAGILISQVTIDDAQPPLDVKAAFDNVTKAQEDMERYKNEAQAYANGVVPEAKGEAARKIAEANGYQAAVIARAEGEAARFESILAQYTKAPEVTRQRLYLDAMQTVLSQSSKVMVDTKNGNPMFYVPLDQMLKNSANVIPLKEPTDINKQPAEKPADSAVGGAP